MGRGVNWTLWRQPGEDMLRAGANARRSADIIPARDGMRNRSPLPRGCARHRTSAVHVILPPGRLRARAMDYLKPSIQSVSACEPRPSAASIAALYPRNAWSLEMTPLVRGFSARSARKPATRQHSLRPSDFDQGRPQCRRTRHGRIAGCRDGGDEALYM